MLKDQELSDLWALYRLTGNSADAASRSEAGLGVSRAMAIAVMLCLVTGQRGGEVIGMRPGELDLNGRTWLLPAARSKSKREHLIPLSETAVTMIEEALLLAQLRVDDPGSDHPLFPSPKDATQPVARLSLTRAMARMTERAGIANATPHDLRRTMATTMSSERIGALTEVVSRVLNHAPPGLGVTGIYNRHAYVAEKRRALERWEQLLLQIVGEQANSNNVIELRGNNASK